ncbi:MAG: metallophosphoesterase [Alphaproteobacteria bacterium]|nr:metallophosphoesterase [Alphaproteobacteria bacterium]
MSDGKLNAKPVRLIHLSDVHFGAENAEALKAVEDFAAHVKPDAIVVAGDLTQNGRRREFAAARDWLQRFSGRSIVTPGNHDTPTYLLHARLFRPFDRYKEYMAGFDSVGKLVELADGRVRIAGMNTARGVQARRNWADGVVDMDDLDIALEKLAGGPASAWRILLCHHPLVEPGHSQIAVSTHRGKEALDRIARARVDAVLTGHIHDAFASPIETAARPMVQMGAGTLSTRLRSTPPSFCVIEIDGDTMVQQIVHVEDGALEILRNYVWSPPVAGTVAPDVR